MSAPFFKNAPSDVVFYGGDPEKLSQVQAVELSICGDKGLADRLNDALTHREGSVLGFSVEKEILNLLDGESASRGDNIGYLRLKCANLA